MGKVVRLTNRKQWARRIIEAWNVARKNTVVGFMLVGQELLAAKAELEHGEWLKMIGSKHDEGELPFQRNVAQQLMAIASCPVFQKAGIARLLPPDYTTMYKLRTLYNRFPDTFDEWIEDGRITPSLQRNEVNKVLRLERVHADEQAQRRDGHDREQLAGVEVGHRLAAVLAGLGRGMRPAVRRLLERPEKHLAHHRE